MKMNSKEIIKKIEMKKLNLKKIEDLKKKIVPLLKKEGVKKAGIFGSYARGEQKKNSDIDILVEIKKDISLLDLIGLQLDIEKVLKKKIDLMEYNEIHKMLKQRILKEEVKII